MKLQNHIYYVREYGVKLELLRVISGCTKNAKIYQGKHKAILQYLKREMTPIIERYANTPVMLSATENKEACIWTAWLQGKENAPEVINLCIESIRKHSNGHKVVILTEENIPRFISLPKEILERYKAGKIGRAHYADILRMSILAKYGGLWLDATTFVTHSVEDTMFNTPFFSVASYNKPVFVTGGKWVVGYIGGYCGSKYLNCISEMLQEYWSKERPCIDYFVFDYLIFLLYETDVEFRKIVDKFMVPENESIALRELINREYDESIVSHLFKQRYFYYLTYRYQYKKRSENGKSTIYNYLVEKYLGK